ncbi:MAG TPA: VWA domain-containing protein [Spirochaetia bacterium]|nr:VWA domain-containing protein [Spirochaetia bacterium]
MKGVMRRRCFIGVVVAFIFCLAASSAFAAGQMSIAQIDSSRILTQQRVDVYVSVTDPKGRPLSGLSGGDFSLFEGAQGTPLQPVSRFSLHTGAPAGEGVTLFLIVDNSKGMIAPIDSAASAELQLTRLDSVKSALGTFLDSIDNPLDRVGIATLDPGFRIESMPTRMRSNTVEAIGRIPRPANVGRALYPSLVAAARELSVTPGRKVIILLTAGGNSAAAPPTGKTNTHEASPGASITEAARALIEAQTTLFLLEMGTGAPESGLKAVAQTTGGDVYTANGENSLAADYMSIRGRIRGDYRLTYVPRMLPGERREVRVVYHGAAGTSDASQYYLPGPVFAPPASSVSLLYLIPLIVSICGGVVVMRMRLLDRRTGASLEFIGPRGTRLLSLGDGPVEIGTGSDRREAIHGQGDGGDEATVRVTARRRGAVIIAKDNGTGSYLITSDEPITVNNRTGRQRLLRSGDVLRIGDESVVFDNPSEIDP